jgi:ankyrin repeat protein
MSRLTCPIYKAAKNGHEDALQLLIESGANINMTIEFFHSDIVNSLYKAYEEKRYNAARLLRTYGARFDGYNIPTGALWNAVNAGKYDEVSYILSHTNGYDVDNTYSLIVGTVPPLIVATKHNYVDIVKLLLKYGAEKHLEWAIDVSAEETDTAKVLIDYRLELYHKEIDRMRKRLIN